MELFTLRLQVLLVRFQCKEVQGHLSKRGEERIGSTTPLPMSARRLSTMNLLLPAEVRQNSMAVQQRLHISELQFDKFTSLSSFWCWKIRVKTQVSSCSDFFYRKLCYGSKKWRWSIQWMNSKSLRSIEGREN